MKHLKGFLSRTRCRNSDRLTKKRRSCCRDRNAGYSRGRIGMLSSVSTLENYIPAMSATLREDPGIKSSKGSIACRSCSLSHPEGLGSVALRHVPPIFVSVIASGVNPSAAALLCCQVRRDQRLERGRVSPGILNQHAPGLLLWQSPTTGSELSDRIQRDQCSPLASKREHGPQTALDWCVQR